MTLPPPGRVVPSRRWAAVGLVLGFVADQQWGDPRRLHPVAGFGKLAQRLERATYTDRRPRGVLHVGLLVGGTVATASATQRALHPAAISTVAATALATWTVLGGRSLQREADTISAQLESGGLPAARVQVTHLVGRDTSQLSADEVARACVESVAENTCDAVVAPLLWGAVAGLPGLLGYRAVNTLDAMIGHRSPRYLRFGWAAARLDDVANWVPARLSGLLAAIAAPAVDGSARAAFGAVRRDAGRHPSPNAGVVEAAFAGALGVRLGGVNRYAGTVEDRGTLGSGRAVRSTDIPRANRLARLVGLGALAVAVGVRAR
ncbi:MAG TPA: cobalamin biosynthesis protein [Propionibacteriaceae bacterium]|nr:cobalamin biosynthesis protein [Propionibacteriaceae bacterium]